MNENSKIECKDCGQMFRDGFEFSDHFQRKSKECLVIVGCNGPDGKPFKKKAA